MASPLTDRSRLRIVLAGTLAVLLAGVIAVLLVVLVGGGTPRGPLLVPRATAQESDPLAFDPAQEQSLEQAAAQGYAHVLYTKSPGGIVASARRTARFRPLVEQAVKGTGIDPDILEAIVLLESAGRPDVIAGRDPANAAGLTQILAETGKDFLGMHVDLAASRRLTAEIAAQQARGHALAVQRLEARRRQVDDRFVPEKALAATVRYLLTARARFGRADLAVVSYHMGIGNLSNVVHDFAGPGTVKQLVARDDLSWARLYFASSPVAHRAAWIRLAGFGDDSQTYDWRVLAAREVMRLYRSDPTRLAQLAVLHRSAASAEYVLRPPGLTDAFSDPHSLADAWHRGLVQPLPSRPALFHLHVSPAMGALASEVGEKPSLYRGLRPDALALLVYLAGRVHAYSGAPTLTVASTVLDDGYRKLLPPDDPNAGTGYAPVAAGYSFDIRRDYASSAQAAAFQYELERLEARNLIAWERWRDTIHVTVSASAASLAPAMLRRVPRPPG